MAFGARLMRLRKGHSESLQEVADAVGVSKAHIWELEKGKAENPTLQLVSRIADHYKVTIASLVGEDTAPSDGDRELARLFRQARELTPDDIAVLDAVVQALLKRSRAARAPANTARTPPRPARTVRLRLRPMDPKALS